MKIHNKFVLKKSLYMFFLISIFITFTWFTDRKIIATGEEGLMFYDPNILFNKFSSGWMEVGTGIYNPGFISRLPPFHFLSFLNLFLEPWFAQAITFFLLISSGIFGFFLFTQTLFGKKISLALKISAPLFYFFNLYSLSQIWNRFLTPGMFAWAFFPWFLMFWIKLLNKLNKKNLILWLISSFLFSNSFSIATNIVTLWFPAFFLALVKIGTIILKERKNRLVQVIGLVLRVGFISSLWFLVNLWWFYPYLRSGTQVFSQEFSWNDNLDSLRGVSQYFPTSEIVYLRQKFLFGENSIFYEFYSNEVVKLLSFFVFLITIIGWWKKKFTKHWFYLTSLILVGWFICKGTNPPFGYSFYSYIFENFPQFGIFRNPYEKFGLVILLPYSIFFALGVDYIYKSFNEFKSFFLVLTFLLFLVVLPWPLWSGSVYSSETRVSVPDYYQQVNDLISSKDKDSRILLMPFFGGEGAKYNWGYQGIQAGDFILENTVISRSFSNELMDQKIVELKNALDNKIGEKEILEDLNVKYIIVTKDLDPILVSNKKVDEAFDTLDKLESLFKVGAFGDLILYEVKSKNNNFIILRGNNIPEYSYRKLSASRYEVDIKGAEFPYYLILKNTFDKSWQANVEGDKLLDHEISLNYANSWYLNKKGDYIVDIKYKVWPWE